jgi:hypothetical protein
VEQHYFPESDAGVIPRKQRYFLTNGVDSLFSSLRAPLMAPVIETVAVIHRIVNTVLAFVIVTVLRPAAEEFISGGTAVFDLRATPNTYLQLASHDAASESSTTER